MPELGRTYTPTAHRVGRYLITGRIGRGGMGMVYRGRDEPLDRDIALKTLTPSGALDAESLQRFAIEARAAARLQHPNIVTVYELGEDRGVHFIAMELLGGMDLDELVRSSPPPLLEERLEIVVQALDGLAYAHEHGIVHRDMKPANIRVLDDGSVKLMDFGIAKLAGTDVTKSGMMVGTVHYMSPEQIRGGTLDGRSDVFSMGVILYELLAGRRPFPGQEPTAVLYKIVHSEPEPLTYELGEPRPQLRELVARALAKDSAQRIASAEELARELRAVLEELRAEQPALSSSEPAESVQVARKLLREGQGAQALQGLRETLVRFPQSLALRRALRSTDRVVHVPSASETSGMDVYPELDSTFRAAATQRVAGPPTEPQPPLVVTQAPVARRLPIPALLAAAGVLLLAVVLGGLLWALLRSPTPDARAAQATRPDLSSTRARADVAEDVSVPAPVVSAAPEVFGFVALSAPYPVDVTYKGRVLVKALAQARLTVPRGRQTLTLMAPAYMLRSDVTIDVPADGEVALRAPALGRINVRAVPDNCQVFVNGSFLDYPPILNRPVAAGRLNVGFKWPDGAHNDESVELAPGGVAYVMGRH